MQKPDAPKTLITAESEGSPTHARELSRFIKNKDKESIIDNDLRWDFYKLLIVPSPVKLFITLSSPIHYPIISKYFKEFVRKYHFTNKNNFLIVAILPTTKLGDSKVKLLWWNKCVNYAKPFESDYTLF